MATFSKALDTFGAFVAGSEILIASMIQFSRNASIRRHSLLPPACAVATLCSLQLIQQAPWRRKKLLALIDHFKTCAKQLDLPSINSASAIQLNYKKIIKP